MYLVFGDLGEWHHHQLSSGKSLWLHHFLAEGVLAYAHTRKKVICRKVRGLDFLFTTILFIGTHQLLKEYINFFTVHQIQ